MLQTYVNHELPSSLWTNYTHFDLMPGGDLNDCVVICNGLTKNLTCDYFAYTSNRLKDISTPDFSTPSFNLRPFNPGLFNHELFNPKAKRNFST